jgi:uncharacterized membrane protein YphA (DoxX/SURF4 family)
MQTAATRGASYQAYQILRLAFVAAPIIAGVDKFLHLLTEWERYLAPVIANLLPVGPHTFMYGVGIVEIVAGVLVAIKPSVGGWIVGVWLLGIVGNLLLHGEYLDIALRDVGLALGAFALARLAVDYERA